VELVEAGEADVGGGAGAEGLVGEHLGRAHQHRRLGVDGGVPGGEAHGVGAEEADEVEELLRHERLDRCRPHRPPAAVAGEHDAADGDEALARAGGRGEHDVVAGGEGDERVLLVPVQRPPGRGRPGGEGVHHLDRIAARRREGVEQGHAHRRAITGAKASTEPSKIVR
jgi:hypothetical protein